MNVAATPVVPNIAPAPLAPAPVPPSQLEQEHVRQALDASQTAMDAIGTVTNLATYTLTILGIVIALIALFGFTAMYRKVQLIAKQIANKRFNDYIETDEFKGLLKVAVEQAFLERTALRLQEEVRDPADQPAFPSGDAA